MPANITAAKITKLMARGLVCGLCVPVIGGDAVGVGVGVGVAVGAGVGTGVGVTTTGVQTAVRVVFCDTTSGGVTSTLFCIQPPKLNPGRVGVGKACSEKPTCPVKLELSFTCKLPSPGLKDIVTAVSWETDTGIHIAFNEVLAVTVNGVLTKAPPIDHPPKV